MLERNITPERLRILLATRYATEADLECLEKDLQVINLKTSLDSTIRKKIQARQVFLQDALGGLLKQKTLFQSSLQDAKEQEDKAYFSQEIAHCTNKIIACYYESQQLKKLREKAQVKLEDLGPDLKAELGHAFDLLHQAKVAHKKALIRLEEEKKEYFKTHFQYALATEYELHYARKKLSEFDLRITNYKSEYKKLLDNTSAELPPLSRPRSLPVKQDLGCTLPSINFLAHVAAPHSERNHQYIPDEKVPAVKLPAINNFLPKKPIADRMVTPVFKPRVERVRVERELEPEPYLTPAEQMQNFIKGLRK